MGTSIGAAVRAGGGRALWCSDGRSDHTRARADDDGLEPVPSLEDLAASCDVVISVCPPVAACDVARSVAGTGFDRLYVDANAISPTTARQVADIVTRNGAWFVDGGIVGPPARREGSTILYLSGTEAPRVVDIFSDSLLDTHVVGDGPGEASAVKMAFSGWTKGSAALLLACRALADAEGVRDGLLHAWERFDASLTPRAEATARGVAPKAWRFSDEMREIATTLEGAGLPDGFHRGAAELYERLAGFKDSEATLPDVLEALLRRR